MKAKKSLGQNFLKEDAIIRKIVSLLNVSKNDLVIEIGPGRGALTKYLSQLDTKVLCIEIDTDMKPILSKYENENLNVIYNDILNTNLKDLLKDYSYNNLYVIGNLPYYITSPIMEYIIKSGIKPDSMVFMVQDEVAKRFSSKPGSKDYGYMTVFLNNYYDVSYEIYVPRDCFDPVPGVDSAVITLNNYRQPLYNEEYFSFLKECFKLKRKTLKNNLAKYDWSIVENILLSNGYSSSVRAEELSNEIFLLIYESLQK